MHIFPPIYFLSVLIITIHGSIMKKYFYLYRIQHTGVDQHYYTVQKYDHPFQNVGHLTTTLDFKRLGLILKLKTITT